MEGSRAHPHESSDAGNATGNSGRPVACSWFAGFFNHMSV